MRSFASDLRLGVRALTRKPTVTVIAVLTLALGIGGSTAMFSVVDAALLRSLPYADPDRLVMVWESPPNDPGARNVINLGNFDDWNAQSRTLAAFAAFVDGSVALTGGGEPEQVPAQYATPELFDVLGAAPLLGRTFAADDGQEGQPGAIVLSHGLWQRRFGGDPTIVGRTIQVSGRDAIVVGVMPEGFGWHVKQGSMTGQPAELWSAWQPASAMKQRRGRFAMAVARLAPGAELAQAKEEMRTIGSRLAQAYPDFNTRWGVNVVGLRDQLSGALRPSLLVLLGAVGFLLLIACANVTNLLLARAADRQREVAVRAALGAARGRIVRQLLTESVILGAVAGVLGVVLAAWGIDVLVGMSPPELGNLPPVRMDLGVLGFALALSFATGIVFGLAPALTSSRVDLAAALKEGGRETGGVRGGRLRGALVVAETALALVLLVGAGLMVKSYARLSSVDPGFDPAHLLTLHVTLPSARYDSGEKILTFVSQTRERLAAIPGVEASGDVSYLPLAGPHAATKVDLEGQPPRPPGQRITTGVNVASSGYFGAMRIPLERGRLFTPDEERTARHVVVVSSTFAKRYFPGEDPLGRRVTIAMKGENVPSTIIGVVGDSVHAGLDRAPEPIAYWPQPELPLASLTFVLRATGDPASLGPAARAAIAAVDPLQPVADVRPMTALVARSIAGARWSTFVLGVFAVVAMLLAAVGIAGVMAVAVAQRTREIGIRMALGARAPSVVALVARRGLALALAGVAVGVGASLLLGRLIRGLLYGVAPTDAATYALVAAGLLVVAAVACVVPARRAARVDPMVALRAE